MDFEKPVETRPAQISLSDVATLNRIFEEQVALGLTPGLQAVIARHGQVLVDVALGLACIDPSELATPRTLFYSWSVAKPVTAMAIHLLIERGQLVLDDPVARVWPEFARNGKANVTVRHVLTHRGGFPITPEALDWTAIGDWQTIVHAMEGLTLEWEPGTAVQYHALNFGWVLGEIVRRVDGRPVQDFVAEEFFSPLGMRDSYFQVTQAELARSAGIYCRDDYDEGVQAAAFFGLPLVRCAVIPASNMHTTARDVARFYQMLLNGGELEGARVLRPETIARARVPSYRPGEYERDTGRPSYRAHGFELGGYGDSMWGGTAGHARTFGHNGFASNVAWADPERDLVCVVLNNGMLPEVANTRRHREIADVLLAACDRA